MAEPPRTPIRVNQGKIATFLGLDRTTVTKILGRTPGYSASKQTIRKVFQAAEVLGYDVRMIRRRFTREYGRAKVDVPCQLTMTLDDGTVFDTGTAVVRNMSISGMLLSEVKLAKMQMPLKPFTLLVQFPDTAGLAELVGECKLVRLAGPVEAGEPLMGVRFVNMTQRDRRRIQAFVNAHSPPAGMAGGDPHRSPQLG